MGSTPGIQSSQLFEIGDRAAHFCVLCFGTGEDCGNGFRFWFCFERRSFAGSLLNGF